ncbi:putative reverse transcriptase domain-containing protein [Tanacetum coccineum]
MPLSTYLNLGLGELAHTKLTVELADRTVKYLEGIAENVLVGIGKFVFPVEFIILVMPEDIKVPLIFGRPFLSTAHAKIDVFKRKITLRVGEEKMILKVSLDHFFRDYIEINDLNVPLELRRDQVDDLIPTIEEGEVVEARNDARMLCKRNQAKTFKSVGIKSLLEVTAAKVCVTAAELNTASIYLMLLVYKLLLLMLKVNAASTNVTTAQRLRLLKEFLLSEKG